MPVRHLCLALALLLASCGGDVASMRPTPAQEFVIEVEGEHFRLRTSNPATASALDARRRAGTLGVVAGRIVRGDGGFNAPWSWHLDPLSIDVPQVSIGAVRRPPLDGPGRPRLLGGHRWDVLPLGRASV
jgi:hypothetical protein